MSSHTRTAFTLTEVMVAITLFAIVITAVYSHALLTTRQIANASREATAEYLANNRAEQIFAEPCATSSGVDTANSVSSTWSVYSDTRVAEILIHTNYSSNSSSRTESYRTAGTCR